MAATTQEQLDAVNNAIAAVAGGAQRYRSPNGDEVEYPALSVLMDTKDRLTSQLAQEQAGAVYVRAGFGRAQ